MKSHRDTANPRWPPKFPKKGFPRITSLSCKYDNYAKNKLNRDGDPHAYTCQILAKTE